MQMAWVPPSPPHPGQRSEERVRTAGLEFPQEVWGASTERAAEYPGVSPYPPLCPCHPLHPLGQLLLHLQSVWDAPGFNHCHSADCAADFGRPGAGFSSLVIRAS